VSSAFPTGLGGTRRARSGSGLLQATDQPVGSTRTVLTERDPSGGVTGLVKRTVLPGGLRVVTDAVPGVRSAAFGVWVGVGSRDERPSQAGSTHFLEHLLFKGTSRRTALDISAELDAVGGESNAFTEKEYTCYHARVPDADLPLAVDIVCDMVTSARVTAADVDGERSVVLEEIAMRDDDPGDLVHDVFAEQLWGDTPLGRPILGSVGSITGMPRAVVNGYYHRRYTAPRIVAAAAGNVDHATVVRLVRAAFGVAGFLTGDAGPEVPRTGTRAPLPRPGVTLVDRRTEQANLLLGMPGLSRTDGRRHALAVLNAVLGGGMSSRLFQEIREKRGLAYSVYSFAERYADAGMLGVQVGCQPGRARQVLGICREVLHDVATSGITADELRIGKGQLRGALVMNLEDTGSRMSRIGAAELLRGRHMSVPDALAEIDAVELDEVQELAADLLSAAPSLAVVGPYRDDSAFADLL
jgi:predicted Zn-dependent peptidase